MTASADRHRQRASTGACRWRRRYSRLAPQAPARLVGAPTAPSAPPGRDRPLQAATVGRAAGEDDVRIARIPALDGDPLRRAEAARRELAVLIDLYDRGMREPLPIYCLTSAAYAARRRPEATRCTPPAASGRPSTCMSARTASPSTGSRWAGQDLCRAAGRASGRRRARRRLARVAELAARALRGTPVGRAARPRADRLQMTLTGPDEFDLLGSLPTGVTVLEASAGTGKTYTIAALAARYVAAGVALERLLMVTFTRNATGELRERVRERCSPPRCAGSSVSRRAARPATTRSWRCWPPATRPPRARGSRAAVAGFDAADDHHHARVLPGGPGRAGIAGDLEPDVAFVEDLSDLAATVVDDLYLRRFQPRRPAEHRSGPGRGHREGRDRQPDRRDRRRRLRGGRAARTARRRRAGRAGGRKRRCR